MNYNFIQMLPGIETYAGGPSTYLQQALQSPPPPQLPADHHGEGRARTEDRESDSGDEISPSQGNHMIASL